MIIKRAEDKHLFEVAEMYQEMTKLFYPYRKISDFETFKKVLFSWIISPLHYVFIAQHKGKAIGLLTLNIDDNCGLNSPCLNVTGTYIKKEFRHSTAIRLLMAKALDIANALEMNLHTSATIDSASLSLKVGGVAQSIQIERAYNG